MTLPNTADAPALSTERVSDLVEKLVAAATAEVEAAAHRTRAQAQIEITQLHRTIDLLREEVQAEHDKLTIVERDLTRARASATQLKEELERERAERARIAATLETVRLLVSSPEPDQQESEPIPLPAADVAEAHDEQTDTGAGAESDDSADFHPADLMSRTAGRDAAPHGDGTGYLGQLLGQIEEIYRSDLESAEGTSDVVARLAANLSYARDAFARRVEAAEDGDAALFDREITRLLEARSGTPFGRHLAMAIRSAAGDRGTVIEFQKERS